MCANNSNHRRELRRKEALERQEARNNRSAKEQLQLILTRRGKSKREWEKLSAEVPVPAKVRKQREAAEA